MSAAETLQNAIKRQKSLIDFYGEQTSVARKYEMKTRIGAAASWAVAGGFLVQGVQEQSLGMIVASTAAGIVGCAYEKGGKDWRDQAEHYVKRQTEETEVQNRLSNPADNETATTETEQ